MAEPDPYAGLGILPISVASLTEHAAFLSPQLTPFLGRNAPKSGLLTGLADIAGFSLAENGSTGATASSANIP